MSTKPATVDEYIESFPESSRPRLRDLRELSRSRVPRATEALKWGHPAYSLGTILFVFSGHKQHANFVFTPSTLRAFVGELEGYETGKGSVKLPYSAPVPSELLGRMIDHRVREYEDDGVTWM